MDTGPWYWVMGPITTSVEWLRLITLDGWMAGFVKIFCGMGRPEEELVEEAEVRLCSLWAGLGLSRPWRVHNALSRDGLPFSSNIVDFQTATKKVFIVFQ